MKPVSFKHSVLTAGVVTALGLVGTATAGTQTEAVSPVTNPTIDNIATATYSVAGVEQPQVESNKVTVVVAPVAQFTLVAPQGASTTDDKNENEKVAPSGTVTFKNILTNVGNETDSYELDLALENNDDIITDEEDDFEFTDLSNMTVKIYNDNDDPSIDDPVETLENVTSGSKVTLGKDQYAVISYTAKAPDTVIGGDTDTITLTATSDNIKAIDNTKASLINESQAVVSVPVFGIEKSASSSNINLNDPNATYNYVIKVTNDETNYSSDADNILIQDNLPAGLAVKDNATNITISSPNANKGTASIIDNADGTQTVSVQGADLKVGETVTITIPVKVVDKAALAAAGSVTNVADVYDNIDDSSVDPTSPDTSSDIHDSTDNSSDTPKVPDTDDGTDPTNPGGDTPVEDSQVTFTDRDITLSKEGNEELPPTTVGGTNNDATYTHTITNSGNQAETDLKLNISNPNEDKINITNVTYTPQDGPAQQLTPNADGSYTLPTLPAGESGTISYDVETNQADSDNPDTPNTDEGKYPTTVSVTAPAGANNDAPTIASKTDTTTVKEMKLEKLQALDEDCDGTADVALSTQEVTALPGECVIYRITASNPFADKAFTNVTIRDTASQWANNANYRANSATTSSDAAGTISATPTNTSGVDSGEVAATFNTISGTDATTSNSGYLQFAIKIKN